MGSISLVNHYFPSAVSKSEIQKPSNKVQLFIMSHLRAAWSSYFLFFGLKDLAFVCKQWKNRSESKSLLDQKIEQTSKNTLCCMAARGSYNLVTGAVETTIALHEYKLIALQNKLQMLHKFSQISFLLANIFSLFHGIGVLIEAQKLCQKASPNELKILRAIQTSAILGILGSIGYIVTMAVTFFACVLTGYAFIFMSIALTIGCLKFIYDFLEVTSIKE